MGLALGMALKFYTSVAKRLKLGVGYNFWFDVSAQLKNKKITYYMQNGDCTCEFSVRLWKWPNLDKNTKN